MADLQQQLQAILSDPEAMGQISALAGALTGAAPESSDPQTDSSASPDLSALFSALGTDSGPDPALLHTAMSLLEEFRSAGDEKSVLLEALRPFLSPQRQEKLDKAAQAARMSRVARTAFQLWREGNLNV